MINPGTDNSDPFKKGEWDLNAMETLSFSLYNQSATESLCESFK